MLVLPLAWRLVRQLQLADDADFSWRAATGAEIVLLRFTLVGGGTGASAGRWTRDCSPEDADEDR